MTGRLAAVAFVVLFVALVGTAVAVAHFASAPRAETPAVRRMPALQDFLSSYRPAADMCIDGIGVSVTQNDVKTVQDALRKVHDELQNASPRVLAWFDDGRVFLGCPSASLQNVTGLVRDASATGRTTFYGRGLSLSSLSAYFLHIYVVSDAQYQIWFGDLPYVRSVEEFACSGHSCGEDTNGLYLNGSARSDDLEEAFRAWFAPYRQ